MKISTAVARISTVGVLMAFAGAAFAQQAYPSKPIRLITPYAPGGSTDVVARLMGQKLAESLGQQVIVDNRPGGNGIIGSKALVGSPPDGYTIMLTTSIHVTNPSLIALPYDTIKDFAPVAPVTRNESILMLHPSVPANNLQEFLALAKSRPGQLNFAFVGVGTPGHLAGEFLSILTGIRMQYIPYKGTGQSSTDLIGGQVQVSFMNPGTAVPHIKTGQLKAIAITGETRKPALPQVPTFAEAGLPSFKTNSWYGILAPAGTSKGVIDKLSTEIAQILAMPNITERLDSLGMAPFIATPDQFAAFIKEDIAQIAKIVKTANIKIEN